MPVITHIEDLRVLAQKRVPRMFYDYADSGSWTESTYRANEADFAKIKLRQRVAVNMEGRSTATTMVGQPVAMPVAIAPTGLTGMQHADGEILAARAARISPSACCMPVRPVGAIATGIAMSWPIMRTRVDRFSMFTATRWRNLIFSKSASLAR